METQQKTRFSVIGDGKQKLESLRANRQTLNKNIYEQQQQATRGGNLEQRSTTQTKIDAGIQDYSGYKMQIADLTAGLTSGLDQYVQNVKDSQNYQGIEKMLSALPFRFLNKKADQKRITRLQQQNPKENLQQILDYGQQLIEEVLAVREDAIQSYARLEQQTDEVLAKIVESQPIQAALKEKKDAMEAQYAELDTQCKTADPAMQVELNQKMNTLGKDLATVRDSYDQAFTQYRIAQESLEGNKQSKAAFETMVRDLGTQSTLIKEKIEDITQIYMAAPEAVKIMMTTKGVEVLDQAINVATQSSVDIITKSSVAVRDATLRREEISLIDEDAMRGYITRMNECVTDFNERFDKIKGKADRSQADRYNLPVDKPAA